ncbi:MAG: hypothetical protein OXB88_06050, partial [Bacteriovoracales bacterium]|nr:hypothetical protein [Bacteriovoracales bacterium]
MPSRSLKKKRKSIKRTRLHTPESYLPSFMRLKEKLKIPKYRRAILALTRHRDKSKYRCLLDFLFVEFFPSWKKECFRFYAGTAPPLKGHPA